ncbi:MAG: hypothetical protein QOD81_4562 [Solirubrobacteraceae bacterium]|jgi:hypothetical protein|nr:hypothetical protein [Solirubrobacteraceae bacterium]
MSADHGPDDPTRAQSRPRPPSGRQPGRGPAVAARVGAAWRALTPDQRLAAIAAVALLVSMLLPWYQETGFAIVRGRPVSLDDSKNAFQVYSFVEAAIFVVVAGVIALLWARAERKAFHLPGGDGAVILGAGVWVMFLTFYRQLDKPDGRQEGPIKTVVGVEWGIFVAFLLGALLAYAGYRIRAAHTPEPPADEAPTTVPPPDPGGSHADAQPRRRPRPAPPGEEPTTVAEPPRRPREGDDAIEGQLSFDEPAEYRPPPRGS